MGFDEPESDPTDVHKLGDVVLRGKGVPQRCTALVVEQFGRIGPST